MALRLTDKQAIVSEVSEVAANSVSAVLAYYRGLTVTEMTALRKKARESGVYLRVVRNTLARRAVADTDFACLTDEFLGPVVIAFSREEPSAAARLFRDFSADHDDLQVKVLALDGKLLSADQLKAVANLPTFEEGIAKLMGTLQAPIVTFARTMAEPGTKLARVLAAVRDQKQS